jgi:subtilisin-like proprotein convertase family protein
VAGLALGGPLALRGIAAGEAKRRKTCGPCKRRKKGKCKPKPAGTACTGGTCQHGTCVAAASPSTGPARTRITRTFTNDATITISPGPDNGGKAAATPATPYPAIIEVSGFTNGTILDVNLTLHALSHTFPGDVDVLLAGPVPGLNAFLMSDVGANAVVSNITLTLDDQAATGLPTPLVTGTFKPTNSASSLGTDIFPMPAPAPSGNVALSVFNASNPNGTWQLFVVDDSGGDGGSMAGGWSLEITAEVDD